MPKGGTQTMRRRSLCHNFPAEFGYLFKYKRIPFDERRREFLGEGMRLFDLKRWNDDVTRSTPQQMDVEGEFVDIAQSPGANTTQLVREAGNDRFVWPIPRQEIDANPQVVQNPGY